jgi:hypothetical protein
MIAQKSEEFPKKRALRQAAGGRYRGSGGRDQGSGISPVTGRFAPARITDPRPPTPPRHSGEGRNPVVLSGGIAAAHRLQRPLHRAARCAVKRTVGKAPRFPVLRFCDGFAPTRKRAKTGVPVTHRPPFAGSAREPGSAGLLPRNDRGSGATAVAGRKPLAPSQPALPACRIARRLVTGLIPDT